MIRFRTMGSDGWIAHYRIVSKLGAGGMGTVYRATDTKLNRDVAIKVLPDAFATDPDRMARFKREAHVLASLNHPNIATIYGVEDRALVMELVEGRTLAGPLPLETALEYGGQIADALEYAHDKGIVHRDLKPANVMVTSDGVVKLLDFGLAKAMSPDTLTADPASSPTFTMSATQHGVILGTARYMSPEQVKGKHVDRRADIWAFGVVLWEMLTGRPLFEGETVTEIIAQVLTKEPDWRQVPSQVHRLLRACLQRDPKQRLKSIGDWRLLLEPQARTAVARWSRWAWAAAAVLLAALGGSGWMWLHRSTRAVGAHYRVELVPPEGTTLHLDASSVQAIAPDGRTVAFIADTDGVSRIWLRPLDSFTARQFPGTELAEGLFWSPDGRRLGFWAWVRIKILDTETGAVKELWEGTNRVLGATWNSTGTIIFAPIGTGLMRVSADGGKAVPAVVLDWRRESNQSWPQFLPDGRHFIYHVRGVRPDTTGTYVGSIDVAPDKQSQRPIVAGASATTYVDGYLLFAQGNTLLAQKFDTAHMTLDGDPVPVADMNSPQETISASTNGILTLSAGGLLSRTVTIVSRDGKRVRSVGPADAYRSLRVAPDGRRVALVRENVDPDTMDIWVMDLAHGVPLRITNDGTTSIYPVWSPDSREIVYASTRPAYLKMYRRAIATGREEPLLPEAEERQVPSDWARDGTAIIYSQFGTSNGSRAFILPLAPGSRPVAIATGEGEFPMAFPVLSPDGRWVSYVSREAGSVEVYVQEVPAMSKKPEPKVRVSAAGGVNPAWSADGKELYFNTPDGRLMAITLQSDGGGHLQAGEQKLLFQLEGTGSYSGGMFWEPLPNGREFVVLRSAPVTARENRIRVLLNWQQALKSKRR
jgi:eukaryotic-like serine/threonine-protein kinase